MLRAQN
jgi:hypothetical protein